MPPHRVSSQPPRDAITMGPQPQQIPDAARSEAAAVCTSKAGGEMPPDVAVVPTTSPSPPPPAVPAPSAIPAPAQPQELSVFVPGFGRKGEGKGANYGVAIAPPTVVAPADLPSALQQPSSPSDLQVDVLQRAQPLIPEPLPATSELVEQWITTCFHRLTNISTNIPPVVGIPACGEVLNAAAEDTHPRRWSMSKAWCATWRSTLLMRCGSTLTDKQSKR